MLAEAAYTAVMVASPPSPISTAPEPVRLPFKRERTAWSRSMAPLSTMLGAGERGSAAARR